MIDQFVGRDFLDYITEHGEDPATIEECIDIIREDGVDTSDFKYPKEFLSFDEYADHLIGAEQLLYRQYGKALLCRNPEKLMQVFGITANTYARETAWQMMHKFTDGFKTPPPDIPGFAVYCKEDRSLTFYAGNLAEMPAVGDIYRGKTVSASYVIDGKKLWQDCRKRVYSVAVADEIICPADMSGWFAGFKRCQEMDLKKLDTTCVTDMSAMFAGCESLTELDLSTSDTSSLKNAEGMFNDCPNLKKLDFPFYKKYREFREGKYQGISDPEVREDRRRRHAILRRLDEMGYPCVSESSAACILSMAKPEVLKKNFPGLQYPYHAKDAKEYAVKAAEREQLDYDIQAAPYATNPQRRSYHPEGRW